MENTIFWMLFFPFFGAFSIGMASLSRYSFFQKWAGLFASGMIALSFLQASRLASALVGPETQPLTLIFAPWIVVPKLTLQWAFRMDALAAIMTLLVTGVGLMIHLYSIGYMSHDPGRTRYFAYLNLFCGFMLVLLTGSSLPVMFVGWEGVGLCSFLLIGFWFEERANAAAGKKAFIVNRIGDVGFLLGMFLLYRSFGTLEISAMASSPLLKELAPTMILEIAALLLFIGCVGKSAQFPLYVWLPDAMAGPTPVSALIHAATMVTAGVYLIARMSFLYALAPITSDLIAYTGAATALFAATIALTQTDIKKVLAFSTISQLGFMVLAMGVGAYAEGIFHLVTHAFFKALLFLAAGSVIHALHGEQNILKMGGLKTYLVSTTLVFISGYLAIIGFPPFSGWCSKDKILYEVLASGHVVLFYVVIVAALLTAAYMTRLFCLVFLGTPRASTRELQEIHESPWVMLAPMWILALLSLFGGAFGVISSLHGVVASADHASSIEPFLSEGQMEVALAVLVIGIMYGTYRFYALYGIKEKFPEPVIALKRIVARQYRIDDIAMWIGGPVTRFTANLLRLVDVYIIDRAVNYVATFAQGAAFSIARLQTGVIQVYALAMGIGSVVMIWWFVHGGMG